MEMPFGCWRAGRISGEQGGGEAGRARPKERRAHHHLGEAGPVAVSARGRLEKQTLKTYMVMLTIRLFSLGCSASGLLASHSSRLLERSPQDFSLHPFSLTSCLVMDGGPKFLSPQVIHWPWWGGQVTRWPQLFSFLGDTLSLMATHYQHTSEKKKKIPQVCLLTMLSHPSHPSPPDAHCLGLLYPETSCLWPLCLLLLGVPSVLFCLCAVRLLVSPVHHSPCAPWFSCPLALLPALCLVAPWPLQIFWVAWKTLATVIGGLLQSHGANSLVPFHESCPGQLFQTLSLLVSLSDTFPLTATLPSPPYSWIAGNKCRPLGNNSPTLPTVQSDLIGAVPSFSLAWRFFSPSTFSYPLASQLIVLLLLATNVIFLLQVKSQVLIVIYTGLYIIWVPSLSPGLMGLLLQTYLPPCNPSKMPSTLPLPGFPPWCPFYLECPPPKSLSLPLFPQASGQMSPQQGGSRCHPTHGHQPLHLSLPTWLSFSSELTTLPLCTSICMLARSGG